MYVEEAGVVFAGDALFAGSVGRCDLPGGSFELLLKGVRRDLLSLPEETQGAFRSRTRNDDWFGKIRKRIPKIVTLAQ